MQAYIAQGIKKSWRHVHLPGMILLALQTCGVMALMIRELEWMDAGCLGSTGKGDEEWVSPSVSD